MATVHFGARFEWDDAKATANARKHGVTFAEAATALVDARGLVAPDLAHADRFVTIGLSATFRTLFVVHTEELAHGRIRIISARKASPTQRRIYESGGV